MSGGTIDEGGARWLLWDLFIRTTHEWATFTKTLRRVKTTHGFALKSFWDVLGRLIDDICVMMTL